VGDNRKTSFSEPVANYCVYVVIALTCLDDAASQEIMINDLCLHESDDRPDNLVRGGRFCLSLDVQN